MCGAIPPLSQYAFMVWRSIKTEAQGQLHLCLYPLDRRLGGPRSLSGCCGEEEMSAPFGNQTMLLQPIADFFNLREGCMLKGCSWGNEL
jgi:hypothetical protein